jgi:hypothetical protein
MNRTWILVALAFTICIFAKDANSQEKRTYSSTLHLIGDSQCAGASSIVKKMDVARSWKNIVSTCKGGTRIPYWNTHIEDVVMNHGDTVVIYLGSNDWGKPDPSIILSKIARANAKCVWVGPPLIRGKDNGIASHLKRVIETDGTCSFLDSRDLKLKLGDGVHPGPQEHKRWLSAAIAKLHR